MLPIGVGLQAACGRHRLSQRGAVHQVYRTRANHRPGNVYLHGPGRHDYELPCANLGVRLDVAFEKQPVGGNGEYGRILDIGALVDPDAAHVRARGRASGGGYHVKDGGVALQGVNSGPRHLAYYGHIVLRSLEYKEYVSGLQCDVVAALGGFDQPAQAHSRAFRDSVADAVPHHCSSARIASDPARYSDGVQQSHPASCTGNSRVRPRSLHISHHKYLAVCAGYVYYGSALQQDVGCSIQQGGFIV
ncbi:MAG: hypothetical protein BWY92_01532 [Firmicutes bacterium ADurb.BinA052]|nr:MAG: hypothetical protein BWY92_01532 [Firmicutes bacterium ADurb.BinA052]